MNSLSKKNIQSLKEIEKELSQSSVQMVQPRYSDDHLFYGSDEEITDVDDQDFNANTDIEELEIVNNDLENNDFNGHEELEALNLVNKNLETEDVREQSSTESHCSNFIETPNGTKSWIPIVDDEFLPKEGTRWSSLDLVYQMYQAYAERAGFSVRKSASKNKKGLLTHKLFTCNKAGVARSRKKKDTTKENENDVEGSTKKERQNRNINYKVTNCPARIKLKKLSGNPPEFELYHFIDKHNHKLGIIENKHLSRSYRQLQFEDQKFLARVSLSKTGATRAHRLRACLKGGYDQVHGTAVDWKNFRRDVNALIGPGDAQMIVDKMTNSKECLPNYSFEYDLDGKELICMFWADGTSKFNYQEFGDVLAFDATYDTNIYDMVFVPFTGIDNHNKCVTFGAGMLKNENIESYTWLLQKFREAHVKQPLLILTDQDPAVKQAVPRVFPELNHRLCMWHIMRKLPNKIIAAILNNDFRRRLIKLVWNVYITPADFEERWTSLISEYNLEDHKWLSDMYVLRELWIPGYFKHLPMCCLMKTTSRSESSNAFFQIFTDPQHTLIQFMLSFEAAMEKQRHTHRMLDNATSDTTPEFQTRLAIEVHANSVYTRSIFKKVQTEIVKGVWSCTQTFYPSEEGFETSTIKHMKNGKVLAQVQVVRNISEGTFECSCDNFNRHGYLCRHIFCVLKSNGINEIPEKYISRRFTRDLLPKEFLGSRHRYGQIHDESHKLSNEAIEIVEFCVSKLRKNRQQLSEYVEQLKKLKAESVSNIPSSSASTDKEEIIAELFGVKKPAEILIHPPKGIRNKGRGKKNDAPAAEKRPRQFHDCHFCKQWVNDHDTRNCPEKKVKVTLVPPSEPK